MNPRRNRSTATTVAAVLVLLPLALAFFTPPPAVAATPAEVEAAITRGKKFLYGLQRAEGRWEPDAKRQGNDNNYDHMQGQTWGGYTAIATYALLASGENPQDPRLVKAVEFLKGADITGVYALGMRCQVWTLLPPTPEIKALARKDAALLLSTLNVSGPGKGGWDYDDPTNQLNNPEGGRIDHSLSQYGVLGLWACDRAGADISPKVWELLEATWLLHQYDDGSWSYDGSKEIKGTTGSTAAMTSAGVATLFITQDHLHANSGLTCQGNVTNEGIERGLAWMTRNIKDAEGNNYAWYGIERIGVASGYKYFGTLDWYEVGSASLLKSQKQNGSWEGGFGGGAPIPATAFALLFLSRGRAPVVMNKLDYTPLPDPALVIPGAGDPAVDPAAASPDGKTPPPGAEKSPAGDSKPAAEPRNAPGPDGKADDATKPADTDAKPADAAGTEPKPLKVQVHWNQRPRDLANLTDWMARRTERDLNWQIVNLSAPPEDLHDAPILYIAGSQGLINLTEADVLKLRMFVEQGGLILGNGDCGKEIFNKSFRKLGRDMFPLYDFRDLPPNHLIFTNQQYNAANWKAKPKVEGLTNGVRELMLLVPDADPAKAWQMRIDKSKEELFQLGANIFLYAIDKKNLLYKGQRYVVAEGPNVASPAQTVRVARVMAGPNPDPEPGGWRRLRNVLRNEYKLELSVERVKLGEKALAGFDVAHLTGTTAFQLSAAERKELSEFVRRGGTLVIDAAGGAAAFATSAEAELAAMFGQSAAEGLATPLPPDDALYTQAAAPLDQFVYRQFARKMVGAGRAPRVRGIKVGDRVAVFYSREDLSTGLVGHSVDGIIGYEPPTATAIMRNVLLYAASAKTGKPPIVVPKSTQKKPDAAVPF